MKEKISVIIPTYKRPMHLTRCLRALTKQRLAKTAFQVIVVSDGKDPLTEQAIRPWLRNSRLNLQYLQTADKAGPAGARNLGWLSAKAPLIAFTDDDCIPGPKWLSAFLEVYSGELLAAFTGKTIVPLPERKTDFALNLQQLETADFITANCACTKLALTLTGGFDERFKMAWREDSDLEFKLLLHEITIRPVPQAVVTHPVREVPWGISIREQKKSLYDALLFKKYPALYRSKIKINIWNYYLIILLSLLLLIALKQRNPMLSVTCAAALLLLFGDLIVKRLRDSHKSIGHITEIISTSLVIPFLSVFWRLYGAIKYRVLFI